MFRKVRAQISILTLCLVVYFGIPVIVQAGGICGGTYYVEGGETVGSIARRCGTTVSAIYAANPGLSASLYSGQALFVPGPNYHTGNAPVNVYNTYVVQHGDTFSEIATRFGVNVYELWTANPHIWNTNVIYVGQVLQLPASAWIVPNPTWTYSGSTWVEVKNTYPETPEHLSYGTAPAGTPKSRVKLSNKAGADVYISLQGTTHDGTKVINEYTVSGSMNVKIPSGMYHYVAYVGGKNFSGNFNLAKNSGRSITFYKDKILVE